MSNQEASYYGQVGYLDSCCYYRFVLVVAGIVLALAADVWGQSQTEPHPQHAGAICRPLPGTVQQAASTQTQMVAPIHTSETLRRPTRRQTQLVRVSLNDNQEAVPIQTPQPRPQQVPEPQQLAAPSQDSILPTPLKQQLQQQHQQQELDALLEIRQRLGGGVRAQLSDLFDASEIEQEFREQLAQIIGRSEPESSPQPSGLQSADRPMKITDDLLHNQFPQHEIPHAGNSSPGAPSGGPAQNIPVPGSPISGDAWQTSPRQDVPHSNVPGHNVPGHNVPGHNVPGHNVPGHNVPGHNVPGHNVPGHNVPGHNVPGHNVPGGVGSLHDGMRQYLQVPAPSGPIASQRPPQIMGVPGMPGPPNVIGVPGAPNSFQRVPHNPDTPHPDSGRIRMVARQMDHLAADLEDLQYYHLADEMRRNAQQLRQSLRQQSTTRQH